MSYKNKHGITIHTAEEFAKMRQAGRIAASVLDFIAPYVQPNITTEELNQLCHNEIIRQDCIPAPLNYRGFPKSICTSVNHVVCHGIPRAKKLKEGDIINIDVTIIKDGWHGDTSRTFPVGGRISVLAKRLVQAAYDGMMAGIEQVKPGNKLGDIGYATEQIAKQNGFSSVRDYCGHGIGNVFHDEPNILHYGKKNTGLTLEEGMCFTIEPMFNAGKQDTILSKLDGWTVTTKDKKLSAQFEHTIGVTKNGYEIFTLSES
jgi:methionyl aminopeptidase